MQIDNWNFSNPVIPMSAEQTAAFSLSRLGPEWPALGRVAAIPGPFHATTSPNPQDIDKPATSYRRE
jgi:hypothetical protein